MRISNKTWAMVKSLCDRSDTSLPVYGRADADSIDVHQDDLNQTLQKAVTSLFGEFPKIQLGKYPKAIEQAIYDGPKARAEPEIHTLADVTSNLVYDDARAKAIQEKIADLALNSMNRVQYMVALTYYLQSIEIDSYLGARIQKRAIAIYDKLLQKSGARQTYRPQDLDLLKACKGGKYHAKVVCKEGKSRYYYDEAKYKAKYGEHSFGQENAENYLKDQIENLFEKTPSIEDFAPIVKKHGSDKVHKLVQGHVDKGTIIYKHGKFIKVKDKK